MTSERTGDDGAWSGDLDAFLGRLRPSPDASTRKRKAQGDNGFVAYYQPIQNLRMGGITGFETLARLRRDGAILPPDAFLPGLTVAGRTRLFHAIFGQTFALFKAAAAAGLDFYVSLNVESSVVLAEGFLDTLEPVLEANSDFAHHLIVEILESEPIADTAGARAAFARLKRLGVHLAIDDVGSAYSSLLNLKDLPVDVIKLDQGFVRDLGRRPDDLSFVISLLSLARGLDKTLVVEGAETPAILDALRVLGVGYAQGYAIAPPMPGAEVLGWLRGFAVRQPTAGPQSLLGAYACHLGFVETCRVLAGQPMQIAWTEHAHDPHVCPVGHFFTRAGLHDTPMGRAHAAFHAVMTEFRTDRAGWEATADRFRDSLRDAMAREAVPVTTPGRG